MAKNLYTIKTTSGEERLYSFTDMLDICKQYLRQQGNLFPTREECLDEIEDFISRFKLVDDKN